MCGTAGHVADVTQGSSFLHSDEIAVFADACYQGAESGLAHRKACAGRDGHMPEPARGGLDKENNSFDMLLKTLFALFVPVDGLPSACNLTVMSAFESKEDRFKNDKNDWHHLKNGAENLN